MYVQLLTIVESTLNILFEADFEANRGNIEECETSFKSAEAMMGLFAFEYNCVSHDWPDTLSHEERTTIQQVLNLHRKVHRKLEIAWGV